MFASHAQAQRLVGEIGGGQVRGIPIAVVPFKSVEPLEHRIDEVVNTDLRASGKFEPIDKMNFMSFPSSDEAVRFKDWRFADAEALVIGEVWQLDGGLYEVRFHIYDVAREQQIGTGKRIPNLRKEDLRTAAHIISDHVYQAFTGRPGSFNSRIAYIKRSEIEYQRYRYQLMVADWDGYGAQEVYGSWSPLLSPDWSPDGSRLAFVSFAEQGSVIQILQLSTGSAEVVASFKGVNSAPAWSPDGTRLAYSTSRHGSPDVYIYDTNTRQHTRVSTHYGIDTEPAWSSDGRSLLFTSNRTGRPQIYSTDLAGNQANRVTFEGKDNANASYDSEDKRIVLVHEGGQIAVMDEENGNITMLTNAKFDESPSFSPNGDMVLYASEDNYQPALIAASSDGRIRTRLELVTGDVREPAWSPLKN
ncbi:UNVERIFIED_CONTAM: hypothetical protein GTU68_035851 [Idotea baltica]|nr:hypothetical protein [Idotea baltica]